MLRRVFCFSLMAVMLLSTSTPLQARSHKHGKHAATANCNNSTQPVRNVILLIGDGMSLAQVSALTLYDGAPGFMKRAQYIGLQPRTLPQAMSQTLIPQHYIKYFF